MDLGHLIKTFNILNVDEDESTAQISKLTFEEHISNKSYIVSDEDEELLLLIGFNKIINLHHITIYASSHSTEGISAPKSVQIYKIDNLAIDFQDIESMKSDRSINCSSKTLQKKQKVIIKLRNNSKNTVKFGRVQYCAVHIKSNQNSTENTFLNGITFTGAIDDKHQNHKIIINKPKVVTELTPSKITNNTKHKPIIDTHRRMLQLTHLTNNLQQIDDEEPDKENTQQCQNLCEMFKHISIKDTSLDSLYLTNPGIIRSRAFLNKDCPLSSCESKKNIGNVMRRYNEYLCNHTSTNNDEEKKASINLNDVYGNGYNNNMLSMDFTHLLIDHVNEFEDIYQYLVNICHNGDDCNISMCIMMKRNHRDKDKLRGNNKLVYNMYCNETEDVDVVMQQLLDSIHCFCLHTFDIGHKLTKSEKENVSRTTQDDGKYDDDNEMKDKVLVKLNTIRLNKQNNRRHFTRLTTNYKNKFMSVCNSFYRFGYRYYYWNSFKTDVDHIDDTRNDWTQNLSANDGDKLCDWFISAHFADFKKEMETHLSVMDWNLTVNKAEIHLNQAIKNFHLIEFNTRDTKLQMYNMKRDECIALSHIMALMFYCNYDYFQRLLSETYRLKPNETTNQMKQRHSKYANIARLLREAVEIFGHTFVSSDTIKIGETGDSQKTFYHGVDDDLRFKSSYTYIKGPFSTSLSHSVATSFCNNNGVILELRMTESMRLGRSGNYACFDVHWLSDYVNELELFFIGGHGQLFITNIIRTTGENYILYVKALGQITTMLNDISVDYTTNDHTAAPESLTDKKIVYGFLLQQFHKYSPNIVQGCKFFKTYPDYVKELAVNHFMNICTMRLFTNKHSVQLIKPLICYDYGWIKLEIVTKVFISLKDIQMIHPHSPVLCSHLFISTLSYLQQNPNTTLEMIRIELKHDASDEKKKDSSYKQRAEFYVKQCSAYFRVIGWILAVSDDIILFYNLQSADANTQLSKLQQKGRLSQKLNAYWG